MTDKEKLVELLCSAGHDAIERCNLYSDCKACEAKSYGVNCRESFAADNLISNGVTIQRWVSVDERLPEEGTDVLAYQNRGEETRVVPANYGCGIWFDCCLDCAADSITHWMPLPEPPKGDHDENNL